ncbi:GPI transamidase component PIG-S [Selaginella moellendorffii]|nr:GPI transamidase component PIG-S [Selaginella moellendorffii]|eukprot:XP_002986510.2 GPI transamidase component PIG-S [Selaginella moellendorffii]
MAGSTRLAIALSALAYILAGLPFWWKLTEVYRVPLPYREVEGFVTKQSSSSAARVHCQLQIVFFSKEETPDRDAKWSDRLEVVLRATREWSNTGSCEIEVAVTLDAKGLCLHKRGGDRAKPLWECGRVPDSLHSQDSTSIDESLKDYIGEDRAGKYTILVLLDGELSQGGGAEAVVGKYRHAWVVFPPSLLGNDEQLTRIISETAGVLLAGGKSATAVAKTMPLAADGSAILSFSLLNADPENWIFNWDFDSVESQYLSPVVDALAPVARLSVESQVLYYTPAAARSQWNADIRSHVIESKDLSFFVNANEWHLDTSAAAAGRSKVLHFAIYVPPVEECPLRIKLSSGRITSSASIDGFTSPGWGGVVIWNPPGCLVADNSTLRQRLNVNDLKTTMEVVVAQLRTLFGLPPVPPRRKAPKLSILFNQRTGFAEWELDLLLRRRVIADVNSTASTLASLLKLVESLPKMVIQQEIGVQVTTSLEAAEKAMDAGNASYEVIGNFSATAKARAEEAFFHPSIMSLLHFPKEHQFAIYTPFFVPVLLHTVISVVKETMRYARKSSRK